MWNRPTENSSVKPVKSPSKARGVIAGLAVALPVVLLGIWFFSGNESPESEDAGKSRGRIKEVKPAPAPKQAVTNDEHKGQVFTHGKWYPEYDEKGGKIWISKNWVRYHTPVVYTNTTNKTRLSPAAKLFDNTVDQDIAELITAPLGTMYIGDVKYGKAFEKKFLKSLTTPIIPSHDDDEWAKEVKRAVNETKIELKARYDAGEDIGQILTDTRREYQKLGVYKADLEQLMRKQLHEAKDDTQMQKDVFEAANKMLAERGIEPIKMPGMLVKKLKLQEKQNESR